MKRERNRWMTAIAVTCLTGAALCGCARGTRDITAELKDSAAREAVEAERSLAEKRRQTTEGKPKTRDLAANDVKSKTSTSRPSSAAATRPDVPGRPKTKARSEFDFEETNTDSAELALRTSTKSRSAKSTPSKKTARPDSSLATAEWAAEEFDQPVRMVSDEEEEDEIPVAESLLDSPTDRVVAEDLFSRTHGDRESESSRGSHLSRPGQSTAKKPPLKHDSSKVAEKKSSIDKKPSYDGVSAHPWAEKAPLVQKDDTSEDEAFAVLDEPSPGKKTKLAPEELASAEDDLVRRPLPGPEDFSEDSDDEALSDTASLALERKRRSEGEDEPNPQKIEAQARVRALLSQAKSHVRKQDYRSAYRAAQTAQRIADSENLFFTGGEEQPSDVVRSVLMKIRFEEQKLASQKNTELTPEDLAAEQTSEEENTPVVERDWTGGPGIAMLDEEDESTSEQANSPESWGDADWKGADFKNRSRDSVVATNPWGMESTVAKSAKPDKSRDSSSNHTVFEDESPDFPNSILEWKSASTKSIAEHSRTSPGGEARGLRGPASTQSEQSEVIQAALASGRAHEQATGRIALAPSPLPFPTGTPAPHTVETEATREHVTTVQPLAVGGDWRSQELSDITTTRTPLLVAPIPPAGADAPEPTTIPTVDLVGIDVQEPPTQAPDNKLWMILCAAAGAFAMLFIRRRPAPISRAKMDGQ